MKIFEELKCRNKILRKDYQANQLKHCAIPHFTRSNEANTIGARNYVSLEQFYDNANKKFVLDFGYPHNSLSIEDTQKYLIKYHNLSVGFINKLLEKIQMIDDKQCTP